MKTKFFLSVIFAIIIYSTDTCPSDSDNDLVARCCFTGCGLGIVFGFNALSTRSQAEDWRYHGNDPGAFIALNGAIGAITGFFIGASCAIAKSCYEDCTKKHLKTA